MTALSRTGIRRAVPWIALGLATVCAAAVLLDCYDRASRDASRLNLVRILRACERYAPYRSMERPLNVQGLVYLGAIEKRTATDPSSGRAYSLRSFREGRPDGCVIAYSPLSASPVDFVYAYLGRSRRGGWIFYADGHGMWYNKVEYNTILTQDRDARDREGG